MSQKYSGGFITKSPVAPTSSAASGIWTLDQQMQAQKAGTWPSPPIFIEDLFSTYLYTGTGAAQTITNNIDLSTKGGLVWTKGRDGAFSHSLVDSTRGISKWLGSNSTSAQDTFTDAITSFNNNGFTLGADTQGGYVNASTYNFASWTFRKQPKFFDIVTYTGTGSARTVAHNLGSVPGCIIIKNYQTAGTSWAVYHRSVGDNNALLLNSTNPSSTYNGAQWWNNTIPTSTQFTVGTNGNVNTSGETYVAYLFAHDAGGFPVSGGGSTNGISCGSFTTDGSGNATVSLGYEPQWVLIKQTDGVDSWYLNDNMRGMAVSGNQPNLSPNSSAAESAGGYNTYPNATGFTASVGIASKTYIYIAIRRGPMKTPTVGTSVFSPTTQTGTGSARSVTGLGFPPDMVMLDSKSFANNFTYDKLRGPNIRLFTNDTAAEVNDANRLTSFDQNGYSLGNLNPNESGISYANWNFRRAPSFFDEVCYTGTGSATTFAHNLGVVPELMIVKNRVTGTNWAVYTSALGATKTLFLNLTNDPSTITSAWNDTAPTASVFTVGSSAATNTSANTYVNYLFATCAGVSKVGSYTGTAAAQTINCGFTAGSRFVMIKRTDSTGDWYVWDSARGIVAGNDPYLLLNDTAAEVTGTDYIDTANSGFEISSTAPAAINASAGTYIFLAIA